MVFNPVAGNHEEIDVLVTFTQGGMDYRIGFACRDHGRRGDKAWIRDLAKQRDELRLTRMVAVHSSGFSKPTHKVAAAENIDLFHLRSQALHEIASEFMMPNEVFAVSIQASAEPQFDIELDSEAIPEATSDLIPLSLMVRAEAIAIPSLHQRILDICQHRILSGLQPPNAALVPCTQSIELEVKYRIDAGSDVLARVGDGPPIRCLSFAGQARVSLHLRPIDGLRAFSFGDTGVISGSAEFPHGRISLTYCKRGQNTWLAPMHPPMRASAPATSLVYMKGRFTEFHVRALGASPDGAIVLNAMLNPTNPSPSAAAAHTPRSRS